MLSRLFKSLASPHASPHLTGLLLLAFLALPGPLCLDIAHCAPNGEPSHEVRSKVIYSAELTKPGLPLPGKTQGLPPQARQIIDALSAVANDRTGLLLTSREHLYRMAHDVRLKQES